MGLSILIMIYFAIDIKFSVYFIFYFGFFSSLLLSLMGILCGIWSKKFDHGINTNFIILPLTFLSGTFYSIDRLPQFWYFSELESIFYMIDGFDMVL